MSFENLLNPISPSAPCGEDLSFASELFAITELKREDDPSLDQGEWVTTLKTADWPAVQAQCTELLANRSKDLRLAMWLAEASTMNSGYSGLRQGLEFCIQLCERFWPDLHPLPDGGDQEERAGNVGWFLNRIVALSTLCPVTKGRSGAYSLQQLQRAKSLQSTPEKLANLAPHEVSLEQFNKALKDTPKDYFKTTLADLVGCQEALVRWQGMLDVSLGDSSPGFTTAREALERAHHELQRLGREVGALSANQPTAAPVTTGTAESSAQMAEQPAGGPIRTPQQAFAQLREVATYFRETQPHSPVAYLVEKAAEWGEMPLHVWLRTVIKDGGTLAGLEEALGVKPEAPGDR
jgi:type VI secretion system protein ImpA